MSSTGRASLHALPKAADGAHRFADALADQLGVRLLPSVMTSTAAMGRALLALAAMDAPPAVVENDRINRLGAA